MTRWRERWASSALTTSTALELRTSTLISTCWPETRLLPRPKRSCAASLRRSASLSRVALGSHCSTESGASPCRHEPASPSSLETGTEPIVAISRRQSLWDSRSGASAQVTSPDSVGWRTPWSITSRRSKSLRREVSDSASSTRAVTSLAARHSPSAARSLEFEIQTHPDFLRRGLASACAAAMIEYCLEHGLRPCWDAHNDVSAALATKLGFTNPAPYTAYEAT